MSFRDQIECDLSTFINLDEFAEVHNVDGKDMPIIIDNDLLEEKRLKYGGQDFFKGEGLFRGEVLFHVAKQEFDKKPVVDKIMRLDNNIYKIIEVTETEGMYTITLERNRA